jgi:hypothetical protein
MNTSGQVSVELRLALEQLRKDIKQAADMLKTGLSGGASDVAAGTAKAAKEMGELEKKTRKVTDALKDQKKAALDAWRASLPSPNVYGVGGAAAPKTNYSGYGPSMNPSQGPMGAGGGLASGPMRQQGTGAPPVAFPVNAPPPVVAAQQSLLAIAAQAGAALAGVRVALGLFRYALQMAATPLRMVAEAADQARRAYARQLQTGLGGAYTIHRSTMADVLGVGENEVEAYGAAVDSLNKHLAWSISTLERTNSAATGVGWQFKILETDLKMLWQVITASVAPAIVMLTRSLSGFVRAIALLIEFNPQLAILMSLLNSRRVGGINVPEPVQSSNRMPASAWEKMGLVLGNGGKNHAEKTAQNTSRMVKLLETMSGKFETSGMSQEDAYNYSRP